VGKAPPPFWKKHGTRSPRPRFTTSPRSSSQFEEEPVTDDENDISIGYRCQNTASRPKVNFTEVWRTLNLGLGLDTCAKMQMAIVLCFYIHAHLFNCCVRRLYKAPRRLVDVAPLSGSRTNQCQTSHSACVLSYTTADIVLEIGGISATLDKATN